MMMKFFSPVVLLLACLAANVSRAGLVGEPAPPLLVHTWLKGGPVEITPGTNIYVLQVWHVNSDGVMANVTNLNEIQRRYKTNGVVVVAISDEPDNVLNQFVQQHGTNVEFAMAADRKRVTTVSYMKPEAQRVIPYAFVVGTNGDLLWHGRPGKGLYLALDWLAAGRFDEAAAKKSDLARHQMMQYLELSEHGSDRAALAGRLMLGNRTNDFGMLCDMAFVISTYPHLHNRDLALANEALDQAQKLVQTNSTAIGVGRAFVLYAAGKHDEALNLATQYLNTAASPADKTNILMCIAQMKAEPSVSRGKADPADPAQPASPAESDGNTHTGQSPKKAPAGTQ